MPLNKDLLKKAEAQESKSAADFTTERQNNRSGHVIETIIAGRSETPQRELNGLNRVEETTPSPRSSNAIIPKNHKLHALDFQDPRQAFNPHKVSVSAKMPPKGSDSLQQTVRGAERGVLHPQQRDASTKAQKQVPKKHALSAFDETMSIDSSYLDDSGFDDNPTVIRVSTLPSATSVQGSEYSMKQPFDYNLEDHVQDGFGPKSIARAIGGTNWQDEVMKEREYQKQKLHNASGSIQENSRIETFKVFQENAAKGRLSGFDAQPETPSRIRSVPPHIDLPAPVPQNPKKSVGFASSPDILGGNQDSPAFHSAEMAREDNVGIFPARPNSVQTITQNIALHQKPHSLHDQSSSHSCQVYAGTNAHASRFPKMTGHRTRAFEQDQKVSAPDSDVQDSSEDETAVRKGETSESDNPFGKTVSSSVPGTKRSFDESNGLDYDEQMLRSMSLSQLQGQTFSRDPRDEIGAPARDSHGNEMSLHQILENLSRMTPEVQRRTFHDQTDEEWSQTGQWFVDKFQEDLRQLMGVRLERRKLALKFEDKIRRQQREIEHSQTGVQIELNELQKGGDGLLKDRRVAGGSRSATPMKASRA